MSRFLKLAAATAAMIIAGSATVAGAQTTTFKGFDSNTSSTPAALANPNSSAASVQFNASLTGTSTESFETFATGASAPLTLTFTGSAGALTASLTGSGGVASATRAAPTSSGQFATDGSKYYAVQAGNFSISFGGPIAAFGFFATDIESDVQLIFSHSVGPNETFAFSTLFPGVDYSSGAVNSGSVNFLGFINTNNPFTGVTFGQGANSGSDILAFDQMTIGDRRQVVALPEPASWALMIAGFGMTGFAMRRRKTALRAKLA